MVSYCCELKCIESPDTVVDGVACALCHAYNYCHCQCVTYMVENRDRIKIEIEMERFMDIKRKLEDAVYCNYDIDCGLEYLDKMKVHLMSLQHLLKISQIKIVTHKCDCVNK